MIQDYVFFTGINILLAWSVYIILLSGSLSFANGAFMALGAYGAGVLTVKFAWPVIPAVLFAGVVAGILGALIGYPALRTRGVYLIMVTVGVTFCTQVTIENIKYVGGVGGFGGMGGAALWHVCSVVGIVGLGLWWASRSHLQRVLDAVREDEEVAGALGINAVYLKVLALGVGASLAAITGGMYGHYMSFISPEHFNVFVSIYVVLYVVLGGVNNMWGPVVGAALMTLAPEMIRGLAQWRPLVFGIIIVLLLLVRPEGLLSFRTVTIRSVKPWSFALFSQLARLWGRRAGAAANAKPGEAAP
jgi:branched-chain amino acid transport system permease protein